MTRLVLDTLFSFYEEFNNKGIEPQMTVDEKQYYVNCNEVAVKDCCPILFEMHLRMVRKILR